MRKQDRSQHSFDPISRDPFSSFVHTPTNHICIHKTKPHFTLHTFALGKAGTGIHHGLGTATVKVIPQRFRSRRYPIVLDHGPRLGIYALPAGPAIAHESTGTLTLVLRSVEGRVGPDAPGRRGAVVVPAGAARVDGTAEGGPAIVAAGGRTGLSVAAAGAGGGTAGAGRRAGGGQRQIPRRSLLGGQVGEVLVVGHLAAAQGVGAAGPAADGTDALVRADGVDAVGRGGAAVAHDMSRGQGALVGVQDLEGEDEALGNDVAAKLVLGGAAGVAAGTF